MPVKVAISGFGRIGRKPPEAVDARVPLDGVVLHRRTRMMYDQHHIFVNGEAYRAGGRDAKLMQQLADERSLDANAVRRASPDARALLQSWCEAGWAHDQSEGLA